MKIIITEEQYKRLVNQDEVDRILDKINELGKESLTPEELHILQNPDEKIEPEEDVKLDAAEEIIFSSEVMSRLISSHLLDYKDIMIIGYEEDGDTVFQIFQVNNITDEDGYSFEYFDAGNKLRLTTSQEKDELLVEGMDKGDAGNSLMEVMKYIKANWEPNIGLPVHVEGIDF